MNGDNKKFRAKTITTDRWVEGRYSIVDGYHVIYEDGSPYLIKLITLEEVK